MMTAGYRSWGLLSAAIFASVLSLSTLERALGEDFSMPHAELQMDHVVVERKGPFEIRVHMPRREILLGDRPIISVELHNVGDRPEVVNLGGVSCFFETMWHAFKDGLEIGELGGSIRCSFDYTVAMSAPEEFSFGVLYPGNYLGYNFGRFLEWRKIGEVECQCTYENETVQVDSRNAWVGRLSARSGPVVVTINAARLAALIEKMKTSADEDERASTAELLGMNRITYAIPALAEVLEGDESLKVRAEAALAMQEFTSEDLGLPRRVDDFDAGVQLARALEWARAFVDEHPELLNPTDEKLEELFERLREEALAESRPAP